MLVCWHGEQRCLGISPANTPCKYCLLADQTFTLPRCRTRFLVTVVKGTNCKNQEHVFRKILKYVRLQGFFMATFLMHTHTQLLFDYCPFCCVNPGCVNTLWECSQALELSELLLSEIILRQIWEVSTVWFHSHQTG